jgi:hypothetical protein
MYEVDRESFPQPALAMGVLTSRKVIGQLGADLSFPENHVIDPGPIF